MPRRKSTPSQWAGQFAGYGNIEQLSTTIMDAGDMITGQAVALNPNEQEWNNFRTIPTVFLNAAEASAGAVAEMNNTEFNDYARHQHGQQAHAVYIPDGYDLDSRGVLRPIPQENAIETHANLPMAFHPDQQPMAAGGGFGGARSLMDIRDAENQILRNAAIARARNAGNNYRPGQDEIEWIPSDDDDVLYD